MYFEKEINVSVKLTADGIGIDTELSGLGLGQIWQICIKYSLFMSLISRSNTLIVYDATLQ